MVVATAWGFSVSGRGFGLRPGQAVTAPDQASAFGQGNLGHVEEHIVFRPKGFSFGGGAMRDAQPRVQPTRLSAVGKQARFGKLDYTESVWSCKDGGRLTPPLGCWLLSML